MVTAIDICREPAFLLPDSAWFYVPSNTAAASSAAHVVSQALAAVLVVSYLVRARFHPL